MEDSWVQAAAIFYSNANTEVTKDHLGQKAGLQHSKPISSLFSCNVFKTERALITPYQTPSHILLSELGTEPRYAISWQLVSCETHWQSIYQPLLWRLNEVAAIPTAQAAEGWAVVQGEGALRICNSAQQLACTKEEYMWGFFLNLKKYK